MATPKQVRRRGRYAILFVVLAATLIATAMALGAVSTDQSMYAPGSVVTISGDNSNNAGYLAGETVDVAVSGPNGWSSSCSATADAGGAWSCHVTLSSDANVSAGGYSYTATGETSGVSESGNFVDDAIVYDAHGNTTTEGHTITITGTETGGACDGPYTFSWTASDPSVSLNNQVDNGSSSSIDATFNGTGTFFLTLEADGTAANPSPHACQVSTPDANHIKVSAPVGNVAPVIAWTANPSTANEGDTKTYGFSITDPDSSAWTFVSGSPDCGTGGSLVANSASIDNTAMTGTFQCFFADGPASPTVSAQVSDGTDNSNTLTQGVTVANVNPTVGAFTPVVTACAVSIASIGFTDPAGGIDNVYMGAINWGDGGGDLATTPATVNYGSTFGPLTHTYTVGGAYTITAKVYDGGPGDTGYGSNTASIDNTFGVVGWPVPPIMSGKTFKVGSTIPVKIQTTGCPGGETVTISLDPATGTVKSSGNSNDGINLRYTSALPGYIYNFSTKTNWPTGYYWVTVNFSGPLAGSYKAQIQLVK